MPSRRQPRPFLLLLALIVTAAAGLPLAARAGSVRLLTWDGPITPVAAEYLAGGIAAAEDARAEAVIIRLDTPGGLDTSMRDMPAPCR